MCFPTRTAISPGAQGPNRRKIAKKNAVSSLGESSQEKYREQRSCGRPCWTLEDFPKGKFLLNMCMSERHTLHTATNVPQTQHSESFGHICQYLFASYLIVRLPVCALFEHGNYLNVI